jgi:arsenate reductase (thioredoxin)
MQMPRLVVFVCLHGSAKSLIAAEHCQQLARGRGMELRATSLGLEPDTEIPEAVVQGLLKDGIDVRGRQPRGVSTEELANAERVVSFGCDLGGMISPGVFVESWDDIPAVSENFARALDRIATRVAQLLDSLDRPTVTAG